MTPEPASRIQSIVVYSAAAAAWTAVVVLLLWWNAENTHGAPHAFIAPGITHLLLWATGLGAGILGINYLHRHDADEALTVTNNMLHTVYGAVPVGICIVRNRLLVGANRHWLESYGYPEGEIIGKSTQLLYENDQEYERVGCELFTDLQQRGIASCETRMRAGDGLFYDVVLTAALLEPGNADTGAVITVQDVTEQKRAEKALRDSERKYRELVQHANSIILNWDRHGRILFLNEFGRRFFGYTEEEIRNRHVVGTIVPETESSGRDLQKLMDDICADPKMFEQNVNENIRHSGERVWIAWTNKIVLDAQGNVSQILSIGTDITERKRADEEIRKLNAELEQRVQERTAELAAKNRELKGFAYTVSHDLKAPLRGIAGYASELERRHKEGLSDRAQFCLTQILTATRNLDDLIEDLLHYSRMEAETPSYSEVNLPDVVHSILQDRKTIIDEQNVDITVEIPFSTICTWERALTQVLINLIDNAIKYSRNSSPPRLLVKAEDLDGVWRVSVSDNGIGFDMKYHDRIFGLFNRLVRVEDYEGSGAGLAIVSKLLDKIHGRVWADSKPDQGTTFFTEFPKTE